MSGVSRGLPAPGWPFGRPVRAGPGARHGGSPRLLAGTRLSQPAQPALAPAGPGWRPLAAAERPHRHGGPGRQRLDPPALRRRDPRRQALRPGQHRHERRDGRDGGVVQGHRRERRAAEGRAQLRMRRGRRGGRRQRHDRRTAALRRGGRRPDPRRHRSEDLPGSAGRADQRLHLQQHQGHLARCGQERREDGRRRQADGHLPDPHRRARARSAACIRCIRSTPVTPTPCPCR